mgnify:CR=1 FL=1
MHPGEKFNTITHLIAAIIAIPGLIYLVMLAVATSDPWKIVSASIYGVTLLLLFISSTLCHWHSGRYEKHFEKLAKTPNDQPKPILPRIRKNKPIKTTIKAILIKIIGPLFNFFMPVSSKSLSNRLGLELISKLLFFSIIANL